MSFDCSGVSHGAISKIRIMKTAFIFPGQGAQVVGMGAEIAQSFPVAAEIFKKANEIIGFDLSGICFEGPAEKLSSTAISQPAIFTASAAILEVLRTEPSTSGIIPDVTAGLSLGEYTALYAAGVISFEDGLALVQNAGRPCRPLPTLTKDQWLASSAWMMIRPIGSVRRPAKGIFWSL